MVVVTTDDVAMQDGAAMQEGESEAGVTAQAAQSSLAVQLSPGDRRAMLALARATLEQFLESETYPPFQADSDGLRQKRGVFVTLRQGEALRGCMGSLVGTRPLYLEVERVAVMAATQDPRFPPVSIAELPELHVEITVLGPLELVADVSTIEIGVHGLFIVKDGRQGALLPQVASDRGWNRTEFLAQVCHKAGLSPDAWNTAELFRFTAEVFEE